MGDPAGPIVSARGLTKRFGTFTAVDGVDFTIGRGEVFGFLGPNGAGKTSTMRMLACMSPVSGGRLEVRGLDPARHGPSIRAGIGVVHQHDALDMELTVLDNLLVYGRYFDISRRVVRARAHELLEFAQLGPRAGSRVEDLSGGMRRRLAIARALISDPELVILDEPTTGLDPQARHLVWERLYELRRRGVTLVITTHYMDEAEQLCDRLVVMDGGRIVAEGSPRALVERHVGREVVEVRLAHGSHGELAARLRPCFDRVEVLADRVWCYGEDGEAMLATIHAQGYATESALVRRGSLEDVFLQLTGRSLVE
ncbi:MAG TPA: ABC transporter ATP-binding protein [Acidimicrobiales bacterium]|nr:ABC transporter ATP-binding protein [Acidimicrobiales bacterium]